MDITFDKYMGLPIKNIAKSTIKFIESNPVNCVLSILWHNTGLSRFQFEPYLNEYKKILLFLYESGYKSITTTEILKRYRWVGAECDN